MSVHDQLARMAPRPLALEREYEALQSLFRAHIDNHRQFSEWAQSRLDAGRWAGHRYTDAIRTEFDKMRALLDERDGAEGVA